MKSMPIRVSSCAYVHNEDVDPKHHVNAAVNRLVARGPRG